MAKKSSSARWMKAHLDDEYVKKARQEGYRSRAVYKLIEMVEKEGFIKQGARVLDLGAAPGSWSQIARRLVGKSGQVIGNDILPIEPIAGVDFLHGDFTKSTVYEQLLNLMAGNKMNVVLCDMAPNMSGQTCVDMAKSIYLCELALDMAKKTLAPKGYFFIKVFHGDGFDGFIKACRSTFVKVKICKPKASRTHSKEVYLLANRLK